MQVREPLADDQPQPQERRELRLPQVIVQPPGDIQIRFLDHVRRVEPSPEPPVQAQVDHPAEPVTVPLEQLREGQAIPRSGAPEESACFRVIRRGDSHILVPARRSDSGTGRDEN